MILGAAGNIMLFLELLLVLATDVRGCRHLVANPGSDQLCSTCIWFRIALLTTTHCPELLRLSSDRLVCFGNPRSYLLLRHGLSKSTTHGFLHLRLQPVKDLSRCIRAHTCICRQCRIILAVDMFCIYHQAPTDSVRVYHDTPLDWRVPFVDDLHQWYSGLFGGPAEFPLELEGREKDKMSLDTVAGLSSGQDLLWFEFPP